MFSIAYHVIDMSGNVLASARNLEVADAIADALFRRGIVCRVSTSTEFLSQLSA